jgi:hypothetical protein
MSIVGKYRKWTNYPDLEGAALLALTEAVVSAQTALEDNQITPYITTCVRFAIKDEIAADRVVGMPARTFRYKAAKGEIRRDGNTDAAIVGVVSRPVLVRADAVVNSSTGVAFNVDPDDRTPYNVPEAKPTGPSCEFVEALNLAIRTEQERKVIDLRMQGYGYTDFESVMGLKKSRVGEIVNGVEKRFNLLYA